MKTLPTNMSALFEKLNDLKTIFKFAEKVVPIIQSLTEFMKEVVPLLENINTSIAESTSKIPMASNQINNVTSATELATTEILDLVDEITSNLEISEKVLNDMILNSGSGIEALGKLQLLLKDNPEALKLLKAYQDAGNHAKRIADLIGYVQRSRTDTYKITLSLQVQDITAQQLAAVNHLIQSVHLKLSALVDNIEQAELGDDVRSIKEHFEEQEHYDPNASYLNAEGRQEAVDKIILTQGSKASQEEIDKLFS
jgi:chemotaxis regulatin CheY-phosphate phosphatase CheZ